jgi:hypothetical protein
VKKKKKPTRKQIETCLFEEQKKRGQDIEDSKRVNKVWLKSGYLNRKLRKIGYKNHQEYIKSDYWVNFKNKVLDNLFYGSCIVCENSEFDFHHLTYRRLGNECLSDVIPLCKKCHYIVRLTGQRYNIGMYDIESAIVKAFKWPLWRVREKIRYFLVQRYHDEFLYGKP